MKNAHKITEQEYESLFDGELGHWKTEPIDLELKNSNCKPVYQKPYPVPKSKEQKLKREILKK